jgi:hypothetical protein
MTTARIVEPFKFSQSDRATLLKALADKASDKSSIESDDQKFADAAESIVETWRASIQLVDQRLSNEDRQEAAARIKSEAEQLAAHLRELPEFNSDQLDACLWSVNTNVATVDRGLSELALAASKFGSLPNEPRNRKHAQAVQMIRALDSAYRQRYESDPGKSRNSAFGRVVTICLRCAGFGTTDPQHLMDRARKV